MQYTRRQFFGSLTRALTENTAEPTQDRMTVDDASADATVPWLRPPGAANEPAFLEKCTRCTDCLEACPYESIRRLAPEWGEAAGTPAIIAHESPCYLCKDLPCIAACTTEALKPLARQDVRIGTAMIEIRRCYQAMGQPCDYCVLRCPLKGEAISWDNRGLPRINAARCTGCGVCVYLCPAEAITASSPQTPDIP
jgi:ferredoxin-type protein NapG